MIHAALAFVVGTAIVTAADLAADVPEQLPVQIGALGLAFMLLMWVLKRWGKQRDDAFTAAEEARSQERTRAALEIDAQEKRHEQEIGRLESRHATELAKLAGDNDTMANALAQMQLVVSRLLGAFMRKDLTDGEREALYADAMRRLFPGKETPPDGVERIVPK